MKKFKMYAEYADGFCYTTIDKNEEYCMCNIATQTEKHGECTFYTGVNGYDEENNCYWVDGEHFSDYDEEKQEYID